MAPIVQYIFFINLLSHIALQNKSIFKMNFVI